MSKKNNKCTFTKKYKILIIVIICLIVLIGTSCTICFLLGKCEKNINNQETSNQEKMLLDREKKLSQNINIEVVKDIFSISRKRQLLLSITNNNSEILANVSNINMKLFDTNNNELVSYPVYATCIPKNSTVYFLVEHDNFDHYELDSSEMVISVNSENECLDYNEKYTFDTNKDFNRVYVSVQNNIGENANFKGYFAFIKSEDYVEIKPFNINNASNEESKNDAVYIPYSYGTSTKLLNYDDYEILINSIEKSK